jgi:hypothetical protein
MHIEGPAEVWTSLAPWTRGARNGERAKTAEKSKIVAKRERRLSL